MLSGLSHNYFDKKISCVFSDLHPILLDFGSALFDAASVVVVRGCQPQAPLPGVYLHVLMKAHASVLVSPMEASGFVRFFTNVHVMNIFQMAPLGHI